MSLSRLGVICEAKLSGLTPSQEGTCQGGRLGPGRGVFERQ